MNLNLKAMLERYNIEIPMLQRDYAQGRISQRKVANEFLDSIFNVLDGDGGSLHIDFIYGYKPDEKDDKFLLIDGQQRITTLWLLHFYLYKKANFLEEIKELLKRFSYKTRKSSTSFCKKLLSKDFDTNKKPSEAIDNQGGVLGDPEDIKNDPTIKAMLYMLDLIFERIKDKKDHKRLAKNLDNITFYLFDMGKFELGEELYIKMNARGKQLSKYENLKSFIEKDLIISQDQKLLESIDTNWSNYFFDSKNPNKFDVRGCNFLHCAALFFALEMQSDIDIREVIANPNQAVNGFYKSLQNIENIILLDRMIHLCLSSDKLKISEFSKLQKILFFDELSYINICHFFSILFFIKENGSIEARDKTAFNDYLRVCRHLIENHPLDSQDNIKSFFYLFKHLSQGCNDIYQFLTNSSTYGFHSNIYFLEARKSKLILSSRDGNEDWEMILNQTSEHKVLKGWIDFLLDFSDNYFQYKKYNQSTKNKALNDPDFQKLQQYTVLTMQILDKNFLNDNLALFQRAFLCIGDFSFYSTNWFYGNSPSDIFRDREALNWILRGNKNRLKLPYFKKFLDTLLESENEKLVDKMWGVIDGVDLSKKEWWEQLLIKDEKMFAFIDKKQEIFQRYPRIRYCDNINKVELLPGLRNTTNVKDLLDYGFYCYCARKKLKISEYESGEKQFGLTFELLPHFLLYGEEVLCKSVESKILWGKKEYEINLKLGSNIFSEFDKILKLITASKN